MTEAVIVEAGRSPIGPCWERSTREFGALLKSEDAKEGPLAFAEKRQPTWKAR